MTAESGQKKLLDVYDEEFVTNLELAKNFIAQLNNTKDQDICKKWIRKIINLKASDPTVKRNRNAFFKYFLRILSKAIYGKKDESFLGGPGDVHEGSFMSRWSPDGRTYVAAKPIPGQGTLVYLAVAKDPTLGWEKGGEKAVPLTVWEQSETVIS